MAQSSPENNMAILANAAELTRNVVSAMISNEKVSTLFARPSARANLYHTVMLAVQKKLEPELRNMPTGQFNRSMLTGSHQSGAKNPNVTA